MLRADDDFQLRIPVKAGPRVVGISFERKLSEPEGVLQPRPTAFALAIDERWNGNAAVGSIEIGGPYSVDGPGDTPSRRRIFTCQPVNSSEEAACARVILSTLARRAYRRPTTDADLETLLEFYAEGRAAGDFEAGVQFAIQRILADPEFIFRVERDPVNIARDTAYHVSDLVLASRLSFFLWSSIPDDELLVLAVHGQLKDPAVLEQQVRRMLADERSKALVENFAGQWLLLPEHAERDPRPEHLSRIR